MLRFSRRLVLYLALLAVPLSVVAAQPAPDTVRVTLESVLERALAVSPDLDQVRAQRTFAEARRRLARASRFLTEFSATSGHAVAPGLDLNATTLPDDALYLDPDVRNDWEELRPFNQLEVEALQPLYTWGELGGNIEAARHGVAVEAAVVESKALEVALRAAELYYNVLLANELFGLAERTRDVVEQAKDEIDRLLQEGATDVDDADLFQVQITEQEFNQRVVEVEQSRITARVALARQLLLPGGTVVVPEAALLEPLEFTLEPLDQYLDRAVDVRPELAQARAGLAAREALVRVARSDFYPKLFAGLRMEYAYAAGRPRQRNPFIGNPFRSNAVEAGLGLRMKLNPFQTRARVAQAEAEREEVRAQLTGAQQLVLFEVERAYRDLITAQAALDARDQALTISKEWLRVEYINFDLELGDTENLVKAVRENLALEARYYEAVQQYNMAVLQLLDAVGTLTHRAESGTLVD